ncbi:hypothetical protein V4E86_13120 [Burkholderia pseudomallei]
MLGILGALTYTKRWKWLWCEWLTTVDHKKLGVMYIVVASSCCCAASPTR